MKKLLIAICCISALACYKPTPDEPTEPTRNEPTTPPPSQPSGGCGTYNGKTLHKGADGGCYYINSNGNKTYVERSNCRC